MNLALIKKEIKSQALSQKGIWIYLAVTLLMSCLSVAFISVKELSLLAQSEVLVTFLKLFMAISVLLVIILGATMFSSEKEQGTLENLLLTPLSKLNIAVAKVIGILSFWLILSLLALPYIYALTFGTDLFIKVIALMYFVGLLLVCSFTCVSIAISAFLSSTKNATLLSIMVFLITALPVFLSTATKKFGIAHFLDQTSPISTSQLTIKNYLVNKYGLLVVFSNVIPVIFFIVVSILILIYASSKLTLKEGE